MLIIYILFVFVLGLIIGSFLNVLILRYNTGHTLSGRSGCFACTKKLSWFELIPIFSFLVQKGRCRGCKSKISWQYPLVELLTGLLFVLVAWKYSFNFTLALFYLVIFSILIVITVYDLRHKIIPDLFVWLFILLAVFQPLLFSYQVGFGEGLLAMVLGVVGNNILSGIAISAFFFVLWLVSKGRWMGFGDVKLAFGIGALLGWRGSISAIVLSFWIGAAVGLILIALTKLQGRFKLKGRFSMKSELPFAPFLVLGLTLNLLFGVTVFFF